MCCLRQATFKENLKPFFGDIVSDFAAFVVLFKMPHEFQQEQNWFHAFKQIVTDLKMETCLNFTM